MSAFTFVNAQSNMRVNGPTGVCPNGTYTYTVTNAPGSANQYRWFLSYNGLATNTNGVSSSSSFSVPFTSYSPGTVQLNVQAWNTNIPDHFNPVASTPVPLQIAMNLKYPVVPNEGTVVFCGANESVLVTSSPYLSNDIDGCYFHYDYEWNAPNGWTWNQGYTSGNNNHNLNIVSQRSDNNTLVSPSSVSFGYNGDVKVSALWNDAYWPAYGGPYTTNTSRTAPIWVGSPVVSNGQVGGNSGSSMPTYVPGGYTTLSVDVAGGGSVNWYITHGSGTLSPNGTTCTASFSNFIRVVAEVSNRCGYGGSWTYYLSTTEGSYGYRVAPNPTKDEVSLLLETKEVAGEVIKSVELYNEKSKLCASIGPDQLQVGKYDKNTIDLDVKDLPRGHYFLHVNRKENTDKYQIVLE